MGLIINTRGVELSETAYIKEEGKYTLKVVKYEDKGFDQKTGDSQFALTFKGKRVGEDKTYDYVEYFVRTENRMFLLALLRDGFKAPEIYDPENLVGRYIIANIKRNEYPKNGETKVNFKADPYHWEYSKLNDNLPPIPEAKEPIEDTFESPIPTGRDIPTIDIDSSEIPF